MRVSEYIADFLYKKGVTDVFGIPGGVILDLMYAFDTHNGIDAHLSYHEQCAGFAALGYAQMKDTIGVAYATKGPGFTNLMTAIADAYYDSLPVVFITAHTAKELPEGCRLVADQDMDTCHMVSNITKYAKRIDSLDEIPSVISCACDIALSGRKGPVFLDFASNLLKQEIEYETISTYESVEKQDIESLINEIRESLNDAKRPALLIGDGINQMFLQKEFNIFAEKAGIPVISSRYSHNVVNNSNIYYGYVGSHGIRYTNFILSKADVVLSLGNRLNFPSKSESYGKITKNAKFLRFDIDEGELRKHSGMNEGHIVNIKDLLIGLSKVTCDFGNHTEWKTTCDTIRKELWDSDVNGVVISIGRLLGSLEGEYTIVSDVGNNEFWLSRACVYEKNNHRTLYSKSFGALGNALGKAIGAYYAKKTPVIVFVGDQGLQMNIQELQFISQHNLPIAIVLINNHSSGMIKDREKASGYNYSLHTTIDSGYRFPNFSKVADAYGIDYYTFNDDLKMQIISKPLFIEMKISDSIVLTPSLPRGRDCQDMEPRIDNVLYNKLNCL